ncbi:hypothetical protein [Sulfurisphaera javensis]|uniref:hypothetical protein n=1 Tax=Sulfurisphaera javensis TaxID=2049879 RepID=UPI0034E8C69F
MKFIFIIGLIIYSLTFIVLWFYFPFLFFLLFLMALLSLVPLKVVYGKLQKIFNIDGIDVYVAKLRYVNAYAIKRSVILENRILRDYDIYNYVLYHEIGHAKNYTNWRYVNTLSGISLVLGLLSENELAKITKHPYLYKLHVLFSFLLFYVFVISLFLLFISLNQNYTLTLIVVLFFSLPFIFSFAFFSNGKSLQTFFFLFMFFLLISAISEPIPFAFLYLSFYYYLISRGVEEIMADLYSISVEKEISLNGAVKFLKITPGLSVYAKLIYFIIPFSTHPPREVRVWLMTKRLAKIKNDKNV